MHTLPKYLTQDELKRFFAAIPSPRDRALFGLVYHYGLRISLRVIIFSEDLGTKMRCCWAERHMLSRQYL